MSRDHNLQVKASKGETRASQESVSISFQIPGEKAHPLDQGSSHTCTCHAVANAVADQLADDNINIDQSSFAQTLVSNNQTIGAVWPHFYDNYHIPIIIMNDNDGEWISVRIKSVREVNKFNGTDKFVLAYNTKKEKQADGTWKWFSYHCVFVKEQSENYYSCVNSWKNIDPYPKVELNRPGNRLWRVKVKVKTPPKGLPKSNIPKNGPATNKVYIKLDVIGEKYLTKYKDKSSQDFKKMASEIEQEVGDIYSTTEEYESTRVEKLWKGSSVVDGEETNQNVLSAKVSIYIKANERIKLLRREIVSGKLGKFKVAAFPDTFEGYSIKRSNRRKRRHSKSLVYEVDGDIGANKLSQGMKDFIASLMSEKDYKEMCRKYLRDKSEADDQIIYKDNFLYDQAYDAICLLIDIGTVSNSSDIERVLNHVNKHILRKFREKFKRKPLVPGNKARGMPFSRDTFQSAPGMPYSRDTFQSAPEMLFSRDTFQSALGMPFSRDTFQSAPGMPFSRDTFQSAPGMLFSRDTFQSAELLPPFSAGEERAQSMSSFFNAEEIAEWMPFSRDRYTSGKLDQNDDVTTLDVDMKYYISQKVGIKWKRLARNLEIEDEVIDEIGKIADNANSANKCMAVFSESGKDKELNWNQIRDALIEIELDNVVSGFEKMYLRNNMYI